MGVKKKKKKKKTEKQILKDWCDDRWPKITKRVWREKFGKGCAWCGKEGQLHSDHIANRGKLSTRWNVQNCVVLCAGCHLFRKKREPAEWSKMVIGHIGIDLWNSLLEQSKKFWDKDIYAVKEYLESFGEDV